MGRPGGVGVREALDLIGELSHERSHFAAEAAGWTRPAAREELYLQMLAMAAGAKGLPWPWDASGVDDSTPAEKKAALEVLRAHSAINWDHPDAPEWKPYPAGGGDGTEGLA